MNSLKILGLMLSLTLSLFSACGDDTPTAPETHELVGTWKADKFTVYRGSISNPDFTFVYTFVNDLQFTLTISADNRWSAESLSLVETKNDSGGWWADGDTLTLYGAGDGDDVYEYSISGNKLTLTSSETVDGYTTFTVIEYTKQ
ncbi:MAG: lipocalin family protein [Candidatus Marinimicrobia bacterium]|nr:lipocalin family protein [Candidatus Neomarinimicrobiota bacterium]